MFIEPNTNIRILRNVPLDNSYKNTIYFTSSTEQFNYFVKFNKHTLQKQSYQRVNKGKARVAIKAESLYDCNYMMFQNESFGTKWFYAFITSVEYINNTVSEITFEIDVLQTWLLDCTFKECFVEREHISVDDIGANTVPEKLETGDYVSSYCGYSDKMGNKKIVIASTVDKDGDDVVGGIYSGVYSGVKLNVFSSAEDANDFLSSITEKGKSDSVVSVFMLPGAFAIESGIAILAYDVIKEKSLTDLGGYIPHNKKLFTYPYNFLYVTNMEGGSAIYPYELFSTDKCCFKIAGDFTCSPSVVLFPINYKGVVSNVDEKLTITGFPQCCFNIDAFKAWMAQQGPGFVMSAAGGALSLAAQYAIGSPFAVASTQSFVANTLSTVYEHAIEPPQAKGGATSSTLFALGMKDFAFLCKHIKPEYARIIDEYFDMYGYATHRVKIPNRYSRPCWNYVKTVGCTIVGGAPADDIAKMCKIHDNGVTYWKPTAVFGVYDHNVNDNRA